MWAAEKNNPLPIASLIPREAQGEAAFGCLVHEGDDKKSERTHHRLPMLIGGFRSAAPCLLIRAYPFPPWSKSTRSGRPIYSSPRKPFELKPRPFRCSISGETEAPTPQTKSKTIELPDPLFAEIDGYARRVSASPITVIRQAWDEFRHQHPQEPASPPRQSAATEELLAMVRSLRGSISLPEDVDDKTLITAARTEKHGPL